MRQETEPQNGVDKFIYTVGRLGGGRVGRLLTSMALSSGFLGVAGPVHGQEMPKPSFEVTESDGKTQEGVLPAIDTVGNPPAEAEMSADLPSAEVRSFQNIYELKWEDLSELGKDGKPMKRSFTFINPPTGNIGFTVNFDRVFQIEVRDEATNRVVVDPVTGQPKMRTTTTADEIKRVMNRYHVPEFIAEPHSIDELTPTIINDETVYLNKQGFSFEQPYGSDNKIPLMKAEWWIKPDSNPNAIVNRYYLYPLKVGEVDNLNEKDKSLPTIDEDNSVALSRFFAGGSAEAIYFYSSSPSNSEFKSNLINTPEQSRLLGEFIQRIRPVSLAPIPATLNNSSDIS